MRVESAMWAWVVLTLLSRGWATLRTCFMLRPHLTLPATVYSTLIRQASQCLHSKFYRLFACIPLTCEWLGNPSQIEPQKVEFWSVSKKEMERKERRCYLFPPWFIITVDGKRANSDASTKFFMPDIQEDIFPRFLSLNGMEILANGFSNMYQLL